MINGHSDYPYWDKKYPPLFQKIIMPASANQLLMAGVTSARDLGGPLEESIAVRDAINKGELPGATMYVSGPFLQHRPYPGTEQFRWGIYGEKDAREKVQKLAKAGVDCIKLIDQDEMTKEEVYAIIDEAHKNNLKVVGHSHRPDEIRIGLAAGVDNFEHTGLSSSPAYPDDIVKALAEKYKVPFHLKNFDTIDYAKTTKKSIETAARDLRYQWFDEILKNSQKNETARLNFLLTGHHADDNIETVTMNFFRGTGIHGLKGILPSNGKIIRPLLFAKRNELETYANQHGIDFVTDYTNLENDYTRNYFRNTILPLVSESYPEAAKNVLKNIQRFRETEILFGQAVEKHKKNLLEYRNNEVHIPALKLLKTIPLVTVFYEIIKEYGFTAHQTEEAITLIKSETGKYIQSATHRIIKNRSWIIISPIQSIEAQHILIEENDHQINFSNGLLSIEKRDIVTFKISIDPLVAQIDFSKINFPLLLRKWKTGDYFYPLGMQKKKKLGRFLSDQKLSITEKENVWVMAMDQKIVWVVGLRIDDRFKVSDTTKKIYFLRQSIRPHN
jgi:tRNA(Ile)-lysidine synthase